MRLFVDVALLFSLLSTVLSLKTVANNNGDEERFSLRSGSRRMDEDCDSIMGIICKLQNTQIFCELMNQVLSQNVEVALRLSLGRPYTVFAPTDDAFKQMEDQFSKLTPEQQNRTLLFHFNEDVVMTNDDLECSSKLISLTGDMSRVKCQRKSPGVYVKFQRGDGNHKLDNLALIDIKSKEACSGIIHRLDQVLLPDLFEPFEGFEPEPPEQKPETDEPTDSPTYSPTESPIEEDTDTPTVSPTLTTIEAEITTSPSGVPTAVPTFLPTLAPNEDNQAAPTPAITFFPQSTEAKPLTFFPQPTEAQPAEEEPDTPKPTPSETETPTDPNEEPEKKKVRINALGINLIMFSTLLLCFVFVCMRR